MGFVAFVINVALEVVVPMHTIFMTNLNFSEFGRAASITVVGIGWITLGYDLYYLLSIRLHNLIPITAFSQLSFLGSGWLYLFFHCMHEVVWQCPADSSHTNLSTKISVNHEIYVLEYIKRFTSLIFFFLIDQDAGVLWPREKSSRCGSCSGSCPPQHYLSLF